MSEALLEPERLLDSAFHVGFSGCRGEEFSGMTLRALTTLTDHLEGIIRMHPDAWFHHGLCVGSDFKAHRIAKTKLYRIHGHPMLNAGIYRADIPFEDVDLWDPEKPSKDRNHAIVNASDFFFATPPGPRGVELQRSGTWQTIRYARTKPELPIAIIWPDGAATYEVGGQGVVGESEYEGS